MKQLIIGNVIRLVASAVVAQTFSGQLKNFQPLRPAGTDTN